MGTVSKTLNIVANTTYNLAIDLWAWSIWATEAGITTTYSSLANLLADEKAVRQLMTVHKSVDYLANYPSGADRETLNTIINNDICAKWINLSDYALDTFYANSDIADVMDTADKYGYGEWGIIDSTTTPPTWGALGNVPIMTANNAPYGTCIFSHEFPNNTRPAYLAFDGIDTGVGWIPFQNSTLSAYIGEYVGYHFVNPICPKKFKVILTRATGIAIEGSNDNSNWTTLVTATLEGGESAVTYEGDISTSDYFVYLRIKYTSAPTASNPMIITLQFYGRELTVKQTSAPTDGREYIQIGSDYYTEDWGEKEFAQGSTRKTIYDHGVELETITGGTKNPDCLTLSAVGTATVTIDKGTRTYMGGKAGLHASGTNRLKCGSGYSAFTASNMPDSNGFDISSISGSVAVGIEQTASGTFDCTEIWIE